MPGRRVTAAQADANMLATARMEAAGYYRDPVNGMWYLKNTPFVPDQLPPVKNMTVQDIHGAIAANQRQAAPLIAPVPPVPPKLPQGIAAAAPQLNPAERAFVRELADYFEQQQRYEHQNHTQTINQNRQAQGQQGFDRNLSVPQPVLNELITMMNSQPTRYIPIRPRPSINDRVMNSFGQNMFSPEFIPEEE